MKLHILGDKTLISYAQLERLGNGVLQLQVTTRERGMAHSTGANEEIDGKLVQGPTVTVFGSEGPPAQGCTLVIEGETGAETDELFCAGAYVSQSANELYIVYMTDLACADRKSIGPAYQAE